MALTDPSQSSVHEGIVKRFIQEDAEPAGWTPIDIQPLVAKSNEIDLRGVEGATSFADFRRLTRAIGNRHTRLRGAPVILDPRQLSGVLAEAKAKGFVGKRTKSVIGARLFGHEIRGA